MTRSALFRAVLEDPFSLSRRLVFADHLEEYEPSEPGYAAHIRDGCELAVLAGPGTEHWGDWRGGDFCSHDGKPPNPHHCRACALAVRMRTGPGMDLRKQLAQDVGHYFRLPADWSGRRDNAANYCACRFWGGLVYRVAIAMGPFRANDAAAAVFAKHPVTFVQVVDRFPGKSGGKRGACWGRAGTPWGGFRMAIPGDIFDFLTPKPEGNPDIRRYRDAGLAVADLGRACADWGRSQAGLAPLGRAEVAAP